MSDIMRVVLFPKDADGAAVTDRQITIDLAVDEAGSAVGPFPAFGRVGDFRKPETVFPFPLMGDGRIDYGAHADDTLRQDRLAIRATQLTPGAEIECTATGGTEIFRIETVTPLTPVSISQNA